MLPAIVHIKRQPSHIEKTSGPSVLLITPFQPVKDDIYAKTKDYLEAADIATTLIYDNEDKTEQIKRLQSCKKMMLFFFNFISYRC